MANMYPLVIPKWLPLLIALQTSAPGKPGGKQPAERSPRSVVIPTVQSADEEDDSPLYSDHTICTLQSPKMYPQVMYSPTAPCHSKIDSNHSPSRTTMTSVAIHEAN